MVEKWKVCCEKPFCSVENINTTCWGWHSPRNKYWFPSLLLYKWQTMAFRTLNLFIVLTLTDSVSIEFLLFHCSLAFCFPPPFSLFLSKTFREGGWGGFHAAFFCGRQDRKGVVEINVALPELQFSIRSDSSNFSVTTSNIVTISWEHKVLVMIKHSYWENTLSCKSCYQTRLLYNNELWTLCSMQWNYYKHQSYFLSSRIRKFTNYPTNVSRRMETESQGNM